MRTRRLWIGIIIVVLIPILVPLVTLPRARAGILRSLQSSLGRRIEARSVRLKLFPLPGVELDEVRLADAPAFGLEPMVMAGSATANINLWDLLRGRVVFSRIHLDSPSINLVRNDAGRWNLAALLERTGAGPQPVRAAGTRFPYVDWDHARVNFKFHQIKTHFYLDQVSGSLVRERSDWRLQMRFVPARSDLNLSNTGVVTLDGRWRAAAGPARREHFDLALHLRNSYLAGSSALLLGHDAGVHGVVSAAMRVAGTSQDFAITGSATAVSVRRWDLLPPPARVSFAFAARYVPALDELQIQDLGDPGWRHVRVQGSVEGVFARPRADLRFQLHDLDAAALLPLMLALKSGLPAGLNAAGEVSGAGQVLWQAGQELPGGEAALRFTGLRLGSARAVLTVPAAEVTWSGNRVRLPVTAAGLRVPGAAATVLRLSGELDRRGFDLQWDSPALTAAASAALSRLVGVRFPWPPQVSGSARLAMRLSALWPQWRRTEWRGTAAFARARFQPSGSAGVELTPLEVSFGSPLHARFRLARLPVQGALDWTSGAVRFQVSGQNVAGAGVWALLHPAPGDLMQRMFGAVLGAPAPPAWLRQLRAQGTVRLQPLIWHGIPVNVQLRLEAAPGSWSASDVVLRFAQGEFVGSGALAGGDYEIHGAVGAAQALDLAPLLASTPFRGALAGHLSGSLLLARPLTGGDLRHLDARGAFLVRAGSLRTASGPWHFQACRGHFRLHQGEAALTDLDCLAAGRHYRGDGQAQFAPASSLAFDLRLRAGATALRLLSPPPSGDR